MLKAPSQARNPKRLSRCLYKKGLYETAVRGLSKALNWQSGGVYWQFKNKDDMVVSCAEEAAIRLERARISPVLKDMRNPEQLMKRLKFRADEVCPTINFLPASIPV